MARKRIPARPRHSHPELVNILAEELRKEGVSSTPEIPTIYEEELPYGAGLHVKVIWSRWGKVPLEERGAIILDAYEQAGMGQERKRILVAMGLTPDEAQRLQMA
ncbi:MAG: hypothetical protein BroJett003_03640 [Planctomycetota bacterium]|nr:MAG: hypothetical protein BroJett003_03640 [Planctomycetota bacterium]